MVMIIIFHIPRIHDTDKSYSVSYDYHSIMHYGQYVSTKNCKRIKCLSCIKGRFEKLIGNIKSLKFN